MGHYLLSHRINVNFASYQVSVLIFSETVEDVRREKSKRNTNQCVSIVVMNVL